MTQPLTEYTPQDLALPDAAYLKRELAAIREFQQLVHQLLIKGTDYGVIPGTDKPTLLKPGAEKVSKLLGLTDHYEILSSIEDWDRPFFRYIVKCSLVSVRTGTVISECIAECNSWETRYRYRWVFDRDVPEGIDKKTLVQRKRQNKTTKQSFTMYRMENEEIYSQVNTLIKMAEKRALVGASLSSGRLSEIFTQDMEDMAGDVIEGTAREVPPEASPTLGHEPQKQSTSTMTKERRDELANLGQVAAGVYGLDYADSLTILVKDKYGVASARDLSSEQVAEVVAHLNKIIDERTEKAEQDQGMLV